jgi:hypothetical protein
MENHRTRTQSAPPWLNRLSIKSKLPGREQIIAAIRSAGSGLLLWAIFVIFLTLVQFASPDLPDNDGFYHIKLASLMRTEGFKPDFPWLPLSILNPREFVDHHFLFHVLLIPFTTGDLRLGAKWAAVFFASLAFLSTWNLFKNQRIPYAWLWAAGLMAVSEAFIYRMSITRAQSLSLAVLMLGLDWLLRGKYNRLALLAFVYVWLYDAFPLLGILAVIIMISTWLVERRLDARPVIYAGIGTVLGLVINPYFPHNLIFASLHILPKLLETTAVSVGNEWYPYDTAQLLENSPLALAAFASGALALGLAGRRIDLRTAAGFLLVCLFGFMLFQSRRFIEYFPPFALVFAAFAWSPLFGTNAMTAGKLNNRIWNGLKGRLPVLALVLVLAAGTWLTFGRARASLQTSKPYGTYSAASAWLQDNTPEGARVFQTDWDDFPRLFFYNHHNTYLIGLDPTYMSLYDADLYELWVEITQGDVEQPSETIQQEFGAQYILTDLRHTGFLEQAGRDPGLEEVYRDGDAVVFRVISFRNS